MQESFRLTSTSEYSVTCRPLSFRRPSADAFFKPISHMRRDVDPHAPTELTDFEVDSIKAHPLIVELREQRDNFSREARKIVEAVGSKITSYTSRRIPTSRARRRA